MTRSILALTLGFLAGCTAGGDSATLDLTGLPELEEGAYALWLDQAGTPVLAGTFTDPSGATFDLDAPLADYDSLDVTVEADADAPDGSTVVLTGAVGEELTFPFDLSTVNGGISLWSPTDDEPDNHEAGAWWFVNDGAGAEPSLTIPALPAGWSFATWTDTQGTTLPMGSFTDAASPDSACLFCGPDADLGAVPGEDFIEGLPASVSTAVNLADGASSVTLSLQPDIWEITSVDSPAFGLDVLSADVPLDQVGGEVFELDSVLDAPGGSLVE